MRVTPTHSIRRAQGMGILPALLAALPALASGAGSVLGSRNQADAEKDAAKREADVQKYLATQARRVGIADAQARAKWVPWAIGGAVVAVGLIAFAASRRRSA